MKEESGQRKLLCYKSSKCMLSWKEQRGKWCKFSRAIHYCMKHGNKYKTLVTSHLEHSTSLVSLYIIENSFNTSSFGLHAMYQCPKFSFFSHQLRLKIFSLKSPSTSPSPAMSKEGQVEQRDTAYEDKVDLFHPSKLLEIFNPIILKGLLQATKLVDFTYPKKTYW